MDCVPFCQSGRELEGAVSGCPLNNLIPEWNDLIYHNNYKQALARLLKLIIFLSLLLGYVLPCVKQHVLVV